MNNYRIYSTLDAGNKLSRLNHSLLLLVKIDNRLLNDVTEVNLKALAEEKLGQFQEIIRTKGLSVSELLQDSIMIASPDLADILLNNLFSNAIRHNTTGGQLRLELNSKQFVISNTGSPKTLDETLIFERFHKSNLSEGLGLGLTIERNICDNYGYRLNYHFEEPFHQFMTLFKVSQALWKRFEKQTLPGLHPGIRPRSLILYHFHRLIT